MAKLLPLSAAIEEVVRDGDRVAFEGFTHLIPYAAGHEAIRQKRKDLTLAFYDAWDEISRRRDTFKAWMGANVMQKGPEAFARYARR